MTALDALTHDAGSRVRKGRTRELGGGLIHHLFRLLKLAQMHSLENQAFKTQLDEVAAAFYDYRLKSGESVSVFFARGVVFFGGEPLKASRSVYEAALELGALMKKCGGSELSFAPDVSVDDLRSFVVATIRTLREPMTKFADFDLQKIRLREVSAAAQLRGLEVEQLGEEQRVVRTYASAVVVMRRFFEDLLRGDAEMPRRIKRIAQALVDLSAGRTPAFLGVTAVRNANHDDAGRAVNTAILAVAMTRKLTEDRTVLTRVAMAALLLDAGKPRALRALRGEEDDPSVIPTMLPDAAERSLPAGTVAVLASLGRINEPTIVRSVIAYEALWRRRLALLGSLYHGLRPTSLHARIVSIARAYNDLLTPQPAEPPRTPAEALLRLEEELASAKDRADQTVLRLLMATVGLLPPGTLVQLSSGASAVVIHGDTGRLRLRILLEPDGALPEGIHELLAGEDGADIARIVGSDPAFAQLTQAPPPARIGPAPTSSVRMDAPPPSIRKNPALSEREAPPSLRASAPTSTITPAPSSNPTLNSPSAPPRSVQLPTQVNSEVGNDERTVAVSISSLSMAPPGSSQVVPPVVGSKAPQGPTFSGDLRRTPLPHLFLNVLARKLSGSLLLTTPSGIESTIVFETGVPGKIQGGATARRLGEILVALGEIQQAQVDAAALKAQKRALPIGKQLVIDGSVPSRTILQALAIQASERMAGLARLEPASLYAFFRDQDLLPNEVSTSVEPLAIVASAMRVWNDLSRMEETLSRLGSRTLLLHSFAALDRFGFSPEEAAQLTWIFEQRLTYPEVKFSCVDTLDSVRLLLYILAIGRHLDLGSNYWPIGVANPNDDSVVASISSVTSVSVNTLPPISHTPPPISVVPSTPSARRVVPPSISKIVPASSVSAPPSSSPRVSVRPESESVSSSPTSVVPPAEESVFLRTATPESNPTPTMASAKDTWEERRKQILEHAQSIEGKDHYEVLGVERDATGIEIQRAFLASVKLFHPDRLPAELSDVSAEASRVFNALVEAHKTLSDANARATYNTSLAAGGGAGVDAEQAEIERVLGAVDSFRKAEILMRRNDLGDAEQLARKAVEMDRQPDHLALLGWILALQDHLAEALPLLNEAVEANPQSENALYYRGTVLKRSGNLSQAISDFRRVIAINSKNLDAAREVRIFEMRHQDDSGSSTHGLFGKLFGKKKK